jgi:D-amino peptidase
MKLFMHWDMEGTSGIFQSRQAWYWEPGLPAGSEAEGRGLLVADVNAAVRAALDAGVDELVVCDTHRGGENFIQEQMLQDPRVRYLWRSVGWEDDRFRWMPWLDERVDGFLLPGHHAMAGTPGAFLPHTCNSGYADFRINGRSVGEMGIEACYAGHWGIPVIYAQGDGAACREAEAFFPGITTACVKRAVDGETAEGLAPEVAHRLCAEKITEAIEKLRQGECQPYQPTLPMTIELRFATAELAEKAAQRPEVTRLDDCTVRYLAERHADITMRLTGTGLEMEPE